MIREMFRFKPKFEQGLFGVVIVMVAGRPLMKDSRQMGAGDQEEAKRG